MFEYQFEAFTIAKRRFLFDQNDTLEVSVVTRLQVAWLRDVLSHPIPSNYKTFESVLTWS